MKIAIIISILATTAVGGWLVTERELQKRNTEEFIQNLEKKTELDKQIVQKVEEIKEKMK